ncbi:MAG TPA: hypothetical protein VKG79_15960 [Bryobacteraceae bacterium]|nr:hypothetical protein [Bryobacteraceae bacterium]
MSSVPRQLRSELIYAAAAANAWLRGMSVPKVALHYRYEPITAVHFIRRCCDVYREVNVEPFVPANVLACAVRNDVVRTHPLRRDAPPPAVRCRIVG